MKNRLYIPIAVILLSSCKPFTQSIRDTLKSEEEVQQDLAHKEQNESNSFPLRVIKTVSSTAALQAAEETLRQLPQFSGKPIMVQQSAHFFGDGRIVLNIQNPDTPQNIDRYVYQRGKWQTPTPVRITKADRLDQQLFPLDRVSFATANKVYTTLKQKIKEIKSEERDPTVYFSFYNDKINWSPRSLRTPRGSYSLSFDEQGNLQSFEKD
ncbi:hypothetical protein [Sphingobacterium paucimobilis]|uniref:Uncharacterized protein n=1 Tax=Sphingobacterium paucimobilis HER1398 TaxID=1346330 RepID=U2HRF7_9SPHI|nr:hypothetical protein [Sphingobacterium paucimobilis]ERJ57880.1 hypothetical protein M472_03780 [Sphingobacterium paucimobilis HER1398]ERJ60331.1 hypothetical protein M472_16350 [Sphingobacterium paucimobilis HER1398]